MEEVDYLDSIWFLFAYSIFLALIVYFWNPLDAEGMTRIFSAISIIIFASIVGVIRRTFLMPLFGVNFNENKDRDK